MITSGKKIPESTVGESLDQMLLHIGEGELEIWKLSVLSDKLMFKQIYSLIYSPDQKIAWRAGWIIDNATENYPELLTSYIPEIVSNLMVTQNGSLKRIFTRMLSRHEIPEKYLGRTVSRCFALLSKSEAVAVRVYAMQVLFNISQLQPGLKQELTVVLESYLEEEESAGFINRAEKLLRKLRV